MILGRRHAFRLKSVARVRNGLIRTRLILAPQGQTKSFSQDIGSLNHRFFSVGRRASTVGSTVLRATSGAKDDQHWLAQVKENGGIIVSVDGIQPDRGNETIYLVRDALTGRMLVAENVLSSETEVMKALLTPVTTLGVKVLGTITDAQESEVLAVEQLWPDVPHQVCQFHGLREASRPAFEVDRKLKTTLRKRVGEKVRVVRRQLRQDRLHAEANEAEQLEALDEYALGMQTALNRDGILPFEYPGVQAGEALDALAESLQRLEKKGEQ